MFEIFYFGIFSSGLFYAYITWYQTTSFFFFSQFISSLILPTICQEKRQWHVLDLTHKKTER
jgi:hypothetical protein